jgi:hypothetical protein
VIAIGNGDVLIGVVMLALAVLLAVGGWSLRGYRGPGPNRTPDRAKSPDGSFQGDVRTSVA